MLDVKVGDGAFMKSIDDARTLAGTILELGPPSRPRGGLRASPTCSRSGGRSETPLRSAKRSRPCAGRARRTSPELAVASSRSPGDPQRRCCSRWRAPERSGALRDGSALGACDRWVHTREAIPRRTRFPARPSSIRSLPNATGTSERLSALAIGIAAMHLRAGRVTKDDRIDHAVGIVCRKKRGDQVSSGEALAEIHARDETSADGRRRRGARRVRAHRRERPRTAQLSSRPSP